MFEPGRRTHLRAALSAAIWLSIGWVVGVLLGIAFWGMTWDTAIGLGLGMLTVVVIGLAAAWWRDTRERR